MRNKRLVSIFLTIIILLTSVTFFAEAVLDKAEPGAEEVIDLEEVVEIQDKDDGEKALNEDEQLSFEEILYKNLDYIYRTNSKPQVGSVGGEWGIIALSRAGYKLADSYLDDYYNNARKYIKDKFKDGKLHRSKSTENSRLILALTAIGKDVEDIDGCNLLEGLRDLNYLKKQGVNGPIWALIALDSHGYNPPKAREGEIQVTREALIDEILRSRLKDGGWSINSLGKKSDPDMTAMALQALSTYKDTKEVGLAIERGLELLSKLQNENAGYSTAFGAGGELENLESSAQVIVALSSLEIDPLKDPRFIKNGRSILDAMRDFLVANGGFSHDLLDRSPDGMATEQGTYALVAYERFLKNKNKLYNMEDVDINKESRKDLYYIKSNLRDELVFNKTYNFWAEGFKNNDQVDIVVEFNGELIEARRGNYSLDLEKDRNRIRIYIKEDGEIKAKLTANIYYQEKEIVLKDKVKISIDKKTIGKGYVLRETEVDLNKGDSVWDITKRVLDENRIGYDYNFTKKYNSVYVESIDGDGEFDHGPDSGWMYNVNGDYPNYGASKYSLRNGDRIQWRYTTNLGEDLGQDLSQWEEEVDKKLLSRLKDYKKRAQDILYNRDLYTKASLRELERALDMKEKTLREVKDKIQALEKAIENIEKVKDFDRLKKDLADLKKLAKDLNRNQYSKEDLARLDDILSMEEKSLGDISKKIKELESFLASLRPKDREEEILFKDQEEISTWALDLVLKASSLGIIDGHKGLFRPKEYVTRAEFIKILLLALDKEVKTGVANNFIDIYKDDWHYAYVNNAFKLGIIRGDNYRYRPGDSITREELAVISARLVGLKATSSPGIPLDYPSISPWAKDSVLEVMDRKIMLGDNNFFRPKDYTSREMAVVIAMRLREVYRDLLEG